MGVSGYFEFITTLFGWIMYDNIWAILADTGIIFLPIIAMMISNIKSSHEGGDDEGSAAVQSLKKIEGDFFAMTAVLIFAVMPMMDVVLGEMKFVKPAINCAVPAETVSAGSTGTTYDGTMASMAGETGRIPLWWAALHWLSKAITSAAVAGIPCSLDLVGVEFELAQARLADPKLNAELAEFNRDCWQRAYSNYARNIDPATLTAEQAKSISWLGSSYFLNGGLYNQYTARSPQARFAYDPARDGSYGDDTGEGGYPTCTQWWQSGTAGLRAQVLANLSPELKNEMVYSANSIINETVEGSLTAAQKEDVFLRKYLTVMRASMERMENAGLATTYGEASYDKTNALLKEASDPDLGWGGTALKYLEAGKEFIVGVGGDIVAVTGMAVNGVLGAPSALGQGMGIRHGVSIFQALILMMFVIALPIMMIIGGYSLKTLVTLSVVFFGLHFMTFLWGVAYWVDNNMMEIFSKGNETSFWDPPSSTVQPLILLYLSRFLYLVCPAMYLIALGWVGVNTNQVIGAMNTHGTHVGVMGNQGGQTISSVASRGTGKMK